MAEAMLSPVKPRPDLTVPSRTDPLVTLMCTVMLTDLRAGSAFAWGLRTGPAGRRVSRSDLQGPSD